MAWRVNLTNALEAYFRRRVLVYLLVGLLFALGSVFGALAVAALPVGAARALGEQLHTYVDTVKTGAPAAPVTLAREAIWRDVVRTAGLCWVLGLSLVGLPLVLVIIFGRGFLLGFSVALLVRELAGAGLLVALVGILPQSLLAVPATVIAGVAALSFGGLLLARRGRAVGEMGRQVLRYTGVSAVAAGLMVGAAVIEGYVAPLLLLWTTRYLT